LSESENIQIWKLESNSVIVSLVSVVSTCANKEVCRDRSMYFCRAKRQYLSTRQQPVWH